MAKLCGGFYDLPHCQYLCLTERFFEPFVTSCQLLTDKRLLKHLFPQNIAHLHLLLPPLQQAGMAVTITT